jgi:Na+/melibiose symporter-like transporter
LISHFFGWGCRLKNHCLDQLLITLPFYSSLAYSTGAFLARMQARYGQRPSRKFSWVVLSAGSLIILAVLIDLIVSLQQTGWNRAYWLVLAMPVALGVYVLYVASTIRRQPV